MNRTAGRRAAAAVALVVAGAALAACGSDPPEPSAGSSRAAGSEGFAGTIGGTSDVEGQQGGSVGGGALAALPIAAMDGPFWELVDQPRVTDPKGWSYLAAQLTEAQVAELGGEVATISDDGEFRLPVGPGEYAVCYWAGETGGRITGCDAVELTDEAELEASWGEAGFRISVAD